MSVTVPFDDFALLDDPQEWSAFGRPSLSPAGLGPDSSPGTCWESSLLIEGMHCAACAVTIEDALRALPGVVNAEVSAGSHRAKVVWMPHAVNPSRLMHAIRDAGYRAVPANDVFARERRLAETRKALWRWLVAGFCMMQVMMYAWPAYVAMPGDLSPEMEQLLRWASWVLTLPVVVFSCGPFFSSAIKDIASRRISMDLPVAIGMLITFGVSTAGTFDAGGLFGREVYFDSLTMFVFFLLTGRWLELRLRDQTAGALEALMNRLPVTVDRRTAGSDVEAQFERIAVRRLVAGDVIRVLPGEAFPADGIVVQGLTRVDEALLTGESKPVARSVGEQVVAGSHNLSGVVLVRVERTGAQTRFAEIVALMENASSSKPQMAVLADRIAKPFLFAVLAASLAACAFWWTRDPQHALMVAVSVLIVTCPCALSLATPAAMLASAGALARKGVLVRRMQALEALGKIDHFVFDKTGTLTSDLMAVTGTRTREGLTKLQALSTAASLARNSLHPASRALVIAAEQAGVADQCIAQGVVEAAGQGLSGHVRDCTHPGSMEAMGVVRLGSPEFAGVQNTAVCGSQVHLSDDRGWLASFELLEQIRPDALATQQALQGAGIKVHVLSGDSAMATRRVAMQLGIESMRGECTPQDKLNFLRELQRQGAHVAMVGDGLNDGPVLAGANVSFAFGRAVPIAQGRADFIVLGEQLGCVAEAVAAARRTMTVVHQNLAWAVLYNVACVPLAIGGLLPAWLAGLGMATSSLLVVLNALRLSRLPHFASPITALVPLTPVARG